MSYEKIFDLLTKPRVAEFLLNIPFKVLSDESVRSAVDRLIEHRIGALPVTNANGQLVGIFTERDLLMKLMDSRFELDSMTVSEVMTAKPAAVSIEASISDVLEIMCKHRCRHVPVVGDRNRLEGIISVKDVVDFLVREIVHGVLQKGK